MPTKKPKKLDRESKQALDTHLDEFMIALGLCVITLQQTQKSTKKDAVTLRVNAVAFRESIRGLQRMQRKLFAQLQEAGVLDGRTDR
ncbi:MAG: hypothetical protein FJ405_06255 [Verrucomicrobia bacterium]|nr:hypothetical protein [Verrucomicrobiota bacterium]